MLNWFKNWFVARSKSTAADDPLLALRGSGRHIWANEHADEYIDNLRRENTD
jgi:hypothetical protein